MLPELSTLLRSLTIPMIKPNLGRLSIFSSKDEPDGEDAGGRGGLLSRCCFLGSTENVERATEFPASGEGVQGEGPAFEAPCPAQHWRDHRVWRALRAALGDSSKQLFLRPLHLDGSLGVGLCLSNLWQCTFADA